MLPGRDRKIHRVSNQLIDIIAEAGDGAALPSRAELALKLETSQVTVDQALSELASVGLVTSGAGKRRVVTSPSSIKPSNIAILWNGSFPATRTNSFEGRLLLGMQLACIDRGTQAHNAPWNDNPLDFMLQVRASALVVVRPHFGLSPILSKLVKLGFSVVTVDGELPVVGVKSAGPDYKQGLNRAMDLLTFHGHKDVGFVTFNPETPSNLGKFQAFLAAAKTHRLLINPQNVQLLTEQFPFDHQSLEMALERGMLDFFEASAMFASDARSSDLLRRLQDLVNSGGWGDQPMRGAYIINVEGSPDEPGPALTIDVEALGAAAIKLALHSQSASYHDRLASMSVHGSSMVGPIR